MVTADPMNHLQGLRARARPGFGSIGAPKWPFAASATAFPEKNVSKHDPKAADLSFQWGQGRGRGAGLGD